MIHDRQWVEAEARRTMVAVAVDNVLVGLFAAAKKPKLVGHPTEFDSPSLSFGEVARAFAERWEAEHGAIPSSVILNERLAEFLRIPEPGHAYSQVGSPPIAAIKVQGEYAVVVIHKAAWN